MIIQLEFHLQKFPQYVLDLQKQLCVIRVETKRVPIYLYFEGNKAPKQDLTYETLNRDESNS